MHGLAHSEMVYCSHASDGWCLSSGGAQMSLINGKIAYTYTVSFFILFVACNVAPEAYASQTPQKVKLINKNI